MNTIGKAERDEWISKINFKIGKPVKKNIRCQSRITIVIKRTIVWRTIFTHKMRVKNGGSNDLNGN